MPRTKTVRLRVCLQFEALATRLMTEEATSHKRNTEDEKKADNTKKADQKKRL